MGQKSDIAPKIQVLANRMRCSKCNANSDDALFGFEEDVKFKADATRPKSNKPIFISKSKLRIKRCQSLEVSVTLIRVCLKCGESRKTGVPNVRIGIPNTCTLEYD